MSFCASYFGLSGPPASPLSASLYGMSPQKSVMFWNTHDCMTSAGPDVFGEFARLALLDDLLEVLELGDVGVREPAVDRLRAETAAILLDVLDLREVLGEQLGAGQLAGADPAADRRRRRRCVNSAAAGAVRGAVRVGVQDW